MEVPETNLLFLMSIPSITNHSSSELALASLITLSHMKNDKENEDLTPNVASIPNRIVQAFNATLTLSMHGVPWHRE